ncbi:MAG TPA: glycosyltransferase [Thermomicrobiales bacterium]|nr:glycosyltransferase [Thermomicrobiales bacterium]
MRVLIACQPGYGHLHPLLPLARASLAKGHEVLVATSASMCPVVEGAGFACAPAGLDWLLARERVAFPELADLPFGDEHFRAQLTRVFRDVTARRMGPDLLDICRAWRPDVIVRDDQEHGALIAAELLGIPHAVAGVLWLYAPDVQALVVDALEALLADFGLAGSPAIDRAYRYLTLAAMPPGWAAPSEVVPPNTHLQRPEAFANEGGDAAEWLNGLPERPLAHANLGTIVAPHTTLHESLLEAFEDLPVNLVLSVGPDHDLDAFGPRPDNVRVIDHIPPGILRRSAVAIVHAGYGSTMAALVSGTPLLLLPVAVDQPRNARRCVDLELGLALFDGARDAQQIREAVRLLIDDPTFRARCLAMRASIEALPGAGRGVALVERLAATHAPIPADAGFETGIA